jgi:flagella basal body P-ring formation protein FlgA
MNKLTNFLLFLSIWILSLNFSEATSFDRQYVENLAKQTVIASLPVPKQGKISVNISPIDPRITIADCSVPLQASLTNSYNARMTNVKVSCADNNWQLFITARFTVTVPVVVAKANINKGSLLDNSTIEIVQFDSAKIRGEVFNNINEFIGTKATRSITKGTPISNQNICLVCKGESVTIYVDHQGLTIKTQGLAVQNGVLGEEIPVKNKRSGKLITAKVKSINKVEVIL